MTTPLTHCRRCGQLLTDPASITAGIGPECQAKEAGRLAAIEQFPVGTRVLMTGGEGRGHTGTVSSVRPYRMNGKPTERPIQVSYERCGSGFYRPDQLVVADPSLMSGSELLAGGVR